MRTQGMKAWTIGNTPLCVSVIGTPLENYRIVANICEQIHDPEPPVPPFGNLMLFDIVGTGTLRTVYFFFCSEFVTLEAVTQLVVDACVRIAKRDADVPGAVIDLASRKAEAQNLVSEIYLWLRGETIFESSTTPLTPTQGTIH